MWGGETKPEPPAQGGRSAARVRCSGPRRRSEGAGRGILAAKRRSHFVTSSAEGSRAGMVTVPAPPDAARALVGRAAELDRLVAARDEATAGRGGVALLAGEPGIGKTRLADELAAIARARGARVVWGRRPEGEGAPP